MNTIETLGQRLQRLRAGAGLTQAALAERAEVPTSSLQNWEIDRREPGWRAVCRLAKVLGITAEDLADTVQVDETGKVARPAGPTKLAERAEVSELPDVKPTKPKGRKLLQYELKPETPPAKPVVQPGRSVQEAAEAAAKADEALAKRNRLKRRK